MGETGISEFTFGFGFLFEQVNRHWGGLSAVPILPDLGAEAGLGWDATIPLVGVDYYYQFKLSDYLWAGNAKYIRDGTFSGPYYRIALHRKRRNEQHRRLRELSVDHQHTYYAAPEFRAYTQFNDAVLARNLIDNSRLIPLTACDDVNDEAQHHIMYQPGVTGFLMRSEPRWHERTETGREIESLYRKSERDWRPIDRSFAEEVHESVRAAALRTVGDADEMPEFALSTLGLGVARADRRVLLQRTADIVSLFFGASMVLVGAPANNNNEQ